MDGVEVGLLLGWPDGRLVGCEEGRALGVAEVGAAVDSGRGCWLDVSNW